VIDLATAAAVRFGWTWHYTIDQVPLSVLVLMLRTARRGDPGEDDTPSMTEIEMDDYVSEHGWNSDTIEHLRRNYYGAEF
jgi:hypothetical protein